MKKAQEMGQPGEFGLRARTGSSSQSRPGACVLKVCIGIAALTLSRFGSTLAAPVLTTTIYAGREYEVRDHDQPTKYVFNGTTRVAAIIGSLSAHQRIQRLRLYPGWNLCSAAVSGPFPASGVETIAEIYEWTPAAGDYSRITLGQSVTAGTVLWVNAKTNGTVSLVGSYSEPVMKQLPPGGTYIPGTGLEAWAPALPSSASRWDFKPQPAHWSQQLGGELATLSSQGAELAPGGAFFLEAPSSVSLEIPDPALRVRYYHQDHIGSSSAITDAAGALIEETAFYPFGVARTEFTPRRAPEPYEFTQKEQDRETGLDYFEARYLAGTLARFFSADQKYAAADKLPAAELSSFLANPQQLNLYAYVQSNPLRWTDPSGLGPLDGAIYYDERKKACDAMPADERAATPSCPPADEEYDWDWFARQYNWVANKYSNYRNEHCFWPLENCDIDWKGTYRSAKCTFLSCDDDGKSKTTSSAPPTSSDKPSAGGSPSATLNEPQRKVISVIAAIVSGLEDMTSSSSTTPAKSPRRESTASRPSDRLPARSSQDQPAKYMEMHLESLMISGAMDAASP